MAARPPGLRPEKCLLVERRVVTGSVWFSPASRYGWFCPSLRGRCPCCTEPLRRLSRWPLSVVDPPPRLGSGTTSISRRCRQPDGARRAQRGASVEQLSGFAGEAQRGWVALAWWEATVRHADGGGHGESRGRSAVENPAIRSVRRYRNSDSLGSRAEPSECPVQKGRRSRWRLDVSARVQLAVAKRRRARRDHPRCGLGEGRYDESPRWALPAHAGHEGVVAYWARRIARAVR